MICFCLTRQAISVAAIIFWYLRAIKMNKYLNIPIKHLLLGTLNKMIRPFWPLLLQFATQHLSTMFIVFKTINKTPPKVQSF
jgi:hypothetical protein